MNQSKEISSFLEQYLFTLSDKEKAEFEGKGFNTWSFGKNKEFSEQKINSILKSRKHARSILFTKKEKIPENGTYGIILNYDGEPKCLIKYTSSDIKPFSEVNLAFAQEDGLDDKGEWVEEHRRFFTGENPKFKDSDLVIFQVFKLIFKSF